MKKIYEICSPEDYYCTADKIRGEQPLTGAYPSRSVYHIQGLSHKFNKFRQLDRFYNGEFDLEPWELRIEGFIEFDGEGL